MLSYDELADALVRGVEMMDRIVTGMDIKCYVPLIEDEEGNVALDPRSPVSLCGCARAAIPLGLGDVSVGGLIDYARERAVNDIVDGEDLDGCATQQESIEDLLGYIFGSKRQAGPRYAGLLNRIARCPVKGCLYSEEPPPARGWNTGCGWHDVWDTIAHLHDGASREHERGWTIPEIAGWLRSLGQMNVEVQ